MQIDFKYYDFLYPKIITFRMCLEFARNQEKLPQKEIKYNVVKCLGSKYFTTKSKVKKIIRRGKLIK